MAQPQREHTTLDESTEFMRELAREAVEGSENDVDVATATVVEKLLADDEAWSKAVEALTETACRLFVRRVRPELRQAIMLSPEAEADRQAAGDATTRRIATAIEYTMMRWPMSSGGWLEDATKETVAKEQASYESREASNGARARMFERIHSAMKGKGTVGEQLTEQKLCKIRDANGVKH